MRIGGGEEVERAIQYIRTYLYINGKGVATGWKLDWKLFNMQGSRVVAILEVYCATGVGSPFGDFTLASHNPGVAENKKENKRTPHRVLALIGRPRASGPPSFP